MLGAAVGAFGLRLTAAVPPGVVRRFENVSDETARLLVWINGDSEEAFNDIDHPQIEADRLAEKFGDETLEKLRGIGVSFEAGVEDGRDAAEWRCRRERAGVHSESVSSHWKYSSMLARMSAAFRWEFAFSAASSGATEMSASTTCWSASTASSRLPVTRQYSSAKST